MSRGPTNLLGPNAALCGHPHGKESGRINYHAPTEKSTTHGEGSDQLQRTEGSSRPRYKGVVKAAGHWQLRQTVYVLCSFRLEVSSVTSETVQRAFGGSDCIQPVGSGKAVHDTAAAPRGGTVSRGATNQVGPTAALCGLPTWQGVRPDQIQRTDRDKYHARRG
jgi:hypothetical protein